MNYGLAGLWWGGSDVCQYLHPKITDKLPGNKKIYKQWIW